MRLSDWLRKSGVTGEVFAERVGVTQSAISKIARGASWPEPDTIAAIERETKGKVTVGDILKTYQAAQRTRARHVAAAE